MSMSGDDNPKTRRPGDISSPSGPGANEARDPTRPGGAGSGQDLSGEARAAAQSAAERVKEDTGSLTEDAKRLAEQTAAKQKSVAADQIGVVASALHSAARELEQHEAGAIGRYAHQAAGSLEQLSERLRTKDIQSIYSDLESFARSQPALFLGSAVAVGFFLGRFFRASAQHQQYGYGGEGYRRSGAARQYRPDYGPDAASPGGFATTESVTPGMGGVDVRS